MVNGYQVSAFFSWITIIIIILFSRCKLKMYGDKTRKIMRLKKVVQEDICTFVLKYKVILLFFMPFLFILKSVHIYIKS